MSPGLPEGVANVVNVLLGEGGKYSGECAAVHEVTGAEIVMLVVIGGEKGHGFSVSIDQRKQSPAITLPQIPDFLRQIADGIEKTGLRGPPIQPPGKA